MEDDKKIFKDVKKGDKIWFVTGVKSGEPGVRLVHVTGVRPDADNALVLFDTDVQNVAVPVASLFKSRITFGSGDGLTAVHTDAGDAAIEYDEARWRDASAAAPAEKTADDGEDEYTVDDLVNDIAAAFIDALTGGGKEDNANCKTAVPEKPAGQENPVDPSGHTELTERSAERETAAPSYPSVPAVLMITVNPSGCEKLDPDYYSDPAAHTPNPLYLDHGVHYLHDILIPDFRRPASLPAADDERFFGDDTEADAAACMIEDWIDSAYPELARLDYGPDEDWYYEVLPGSAIGVDTNAVELNPFKTEE